MIIKIPGSGGIEPTQKISLRCPGCRQLGTFESIGASDHAFSTPQYEYRLGQRRCPNPQCYAHVFFAWEGRSQRLLTYPPERIDFDAASVPPRIVSALEEAVACHASHAYRASALMVRRTLEELCKDRGAAGKNLKERIEALGQKAVLPPELLAALDAVRLLGNDAAHVDAQVYDSVGREEVEIALEFTKEVLKAVYQYASLLQKLEGLKRVQHPEGDR